MDLDALRAIAIELSIPKDVEEFYRHCDGMPEDSADPRNEVHLNSASLIKEYNGELLIDKGFSFCDKFNIIGNIMVWSSVIMVGKSGYSDVENGIYLLTSKNPERIFSTFGEFIDEAITGDLII